MQQKKRPGMERLGGPAPLETLQEVTQVCQHKFSRRCCNFIQPPSVRHHSARFVSLIAFRQLHPNAGLRLPEQKALACCCRMRCFADVLARSLKRITRLLHAFCSIGPHEASWIFQAIIQAAKHIAWLKQGKEPNGSLDGRLNMRIAADARALVFKLVRHLCRATQLPIRMPGLSQLRNNRPCWTMPLHAWMVLGFCLLEEWAFTSMEKCVACMPRCWMW